MNQFMKKLGEIVKQIIFWKGEPGLYVTRGFMKIFDQLFFTLLPHYEGVRHLAIDSCYVFYNHWNAMMSLEEDGSFTISRVRFVDYDLNFYHFDKKVLGMVKCHTKHSNNHSEVWAISHHYTECHKYTLQGLWVIGVLSTIKWWITFQSICKINLHFFPCLFDMFFTDDSTTSATIS